MFVREERHRGELFDLGEDPGGTHNLHGKSPETSREMDAELEREMKSLTKDATPGRVLQFEEKFFKKLRSPGYVQ